MYFLQLTTLYNWVDMMINKIIAYIAYINLVDITDQRGKSM